MWRLTNDTAYASGRIWGRDKDGVHEWIVVVKGTFDVQRDGKLVRAEKQVEPLLVAEPNGEDGKSSLRYEADLVGPKPTTDILLNGTAYAPKGKPAAAFLVSLRVGNVYKQVKVVGNRTWRSGP